VRTTIWYFGSRDNEHCVLAWWSGTLLKAAVSRSKSRTNPHPVDNLFSARVIGEPIRCWTWFDAACDGKVQVGQSAENARVCATFRTREDPMYVFVRRSCPTTPHGKSATWSRPTFRTGGAELMFCVWQVAQSVGHEISNSSVT
jgi:hypothetical protein